MAFSVYAFDRMACKSRSWFVLYTLNKTNQLRDWQVMRTTSWTLKTTQHERQLYQQGKTRTWPPSLLSHQCFNQVNTASFFGSWAVARKGFYHFYFTCEGQVQASSPVYVDHSFVRRSFCSFVYLTYGKPSSSIFFQNVWYSTLNMFFSTCMV